MATALALALVIAGCSGSHGPTSPQAPNVQFDSLAIVNAGGVHWLACFVTNVGQATAYDVMVYWHYTSDDSARESRVQPRNLNRGESGFALTTRADNIAWTWPTGADSIRWSEMP